MIEVKVENSCTKNTDTTDTSAKDTPNSYIDRRQVAKVNSGIHDNQPPGTNHEQLTSETNLNPKKLFPVSACSTDAASGLGLDSDHEGIQLQEQHMEEIQQLIYERDAARNEAEVSKEILSCVMEAVQILTTQMKKSHFELMNSHLTSPTVSAVSQRAQSVPGITSMVSDLSGDFSRTRTESIDEGIEEEETEIENGGENHNVKNNN